jgi:hypothetical protein
MQTGATMQKKLLVIPDHIYIKIKKFRHSQEISSEAEAIRVILAAGIAFLEGETDVGLSQTITSRTPSESDQTGQSGETETDVSVEQSSTA